MAAFRYLHSYDPRWRFSTWLYRIAIRNAHQLRSETLLEIQDVGDAENDPLLRCMVDAETENLWMVAKRSLSDEVFAAMWLRYAEDMSINDIAAALERSASWTKVNLMRARQVLDTEMNRVTKTGTAYG